MRTETADRATDVAEPESTSGLDSSAGAAVQNASAGQITVYFDGSCPLCSAEISHYAAKDKEQRLCFLDVSQQGVNPGADLSSETAMQRFHVRLPDGTLKSGASGFVVLWEELPGWRWLAKIARLPSVTPLLELFYRCFLPVRPMLSRLAARLGAKAAS
ncbi:MAG: DUF393 domain-containing protein [Pseudomonadota bacterium]